VPNYNYVLLNDICNFEKGSTGLAKAVPGEYPLVTTGVNRKTCESYQFDKSAVCIPLVSSTGHGHASLKYVHYQKGKFALGTILVALTSKDDNILDIQFLHLYLFQLKNQILVPLMSGAANVSLSIKKIKKIEIPLQSIERQKEIVNNFNLIEMEDKELRKELIHQQTLLKILRHQILQEAIEGKLTKDWRTENLNVEPASELLKRIKTEKEKLIKEKKIKKQKQLPPITEKDKLFELPEKWEWCRLGNLGFTQTGTTPSTYEKDNYGDYISFVQPADIKIFGEIDYDVRKLSQKGLNNGRLINANSVLMVCIGGSIGKSAINLYDVSCNQQINTITPLAKTNPLFVQEIFQSPYFQLAVWSKASGGTTPIVNKTKWETIVVPLAPLNEQKVIVEKVEKLFAICDKLGNEINENIIHSEQLMQAVLREAFEGSE